MSVRVVLLSGLVLISSIDLFSWQGRKYVQIQSRVVNVRTGPTTRAARVTQVVRGEIFELKGEEGRWYVIQLFSPVPRYLHKSTASTIDYEPELTADTETRQRIYREWQSAGNRAREETDKRFSAESQFRQHLEYSQLLNDRYKLEVMQKYEVPAPLFRRILIEGNRKGW